MNGKDFFAGGYQNYDLSDFEEELKRKKDEVGFIESKIENMKAEKEALNNRLSIVKEAHDGGYEENEIFKAVKEIRVGELLDFLKENYDFKPSDLSVYSKISWITAKRLSDIAVGLKHLKEKNNEDLH